MNRQILVGKFLSSLCLASCLISCTGTGEKEPRSRMSLEGNWAVRLDSTDIGEHERWWNLETTDSMRLPGTTDLAKIGPLNEKIGLMKSEILLFVLSVAGFSGIGGDDAVERCFLCAHSGESEFDHMCFSFCLSAE